MAQVSNATILNIFKKVYGDISNLVPEGYKIQEAIKFSQKERVGESYNEAVVLTNETGYTLGGSAGDIFDINPAVAGTVQQASISPYVSVLSSVVPWSVLSRSAQGGERAFIDGTKHIVKNNLTSHMSLIETLCLYGQSAEGLGLVSYATATYRNVSLSTGTGTVGGVAFTNGVNTASKVIMFAPGQFASGIWVGKEGMAIKQVVVSSGAISGSGKLVSVDSENGLIYVDFTPVVATAVGSHKIVLDGMDASKEFVGMQKILTNTGSLFGISASTSSGYSLWRGSQTTLSATLLTFARIQSAAANASNRGGLDQDVSVYCNPRTFANLVNAESARRVYDKSFSSSEFDNGAEAIKFYYSGGSLSVSGHRYVKEGEAYGLCMDTWLRSGSSDVSLKVPGVDKDIIFPLQNSSAQAFRSFSDQYVFCRAPARSFLINGINDESAT